MMILSCLNVFAERTIENLQMKIAKSYVLFLNGPNPFGNQLFICIHVYIISTIYLSIIQTLQSPFECLVLYKDFSFSCFFYCKSTVCAQLNYIEESMTCCKFFNSKFRQQIGVCLISISSLYLCSKIFDFDKVELCEGHPALFILTDSSYIYHFYRGG